MKFISTNEHAPPVSFSEAAQQGLAPDGGLYMPVEWPQLSNSFLEQLPDKSLKEIGLSICRLFINELEDDVLKSIVDDAFNFDAPLVSLDKDCSILELFHGPSLAFKDFGARFMSRLFSVLRRKSDRDLIILAATSGDTGSAVAQGFLGVEGIKVCLLYPSGKVSHIQEQQLATVADNVTALEINGTFDDCQDLVKKAFSDQSLQQRLSLSSANSINIARLLPQMFYYFYAVGQLDRPYAPIFCVPSGNLGNLTAGLMAQKIGLPATGFLAATNTNDIVSRYLVTGEFNPKPSERTISNAMDVGDPSNFDRILSLFGNDHSKIKQHIWSASISDTDTKTAIQEVYERQHYLMDPHTAVGYLAVQKYRNSAAPYFGEEADIPSILLATAHPSKFYDVIEPVIQADVNMPERLQTYLKKEKQSIPLDGNYHDFKSWLISQYV